MFTVAETREAHASLREICEDYLRPMLDVPAGLIGMCGEAATGATVEVAIYKPIADHHLRQARFIFEVIEPAEPDADPALTGRAGRAYEISEKSVTRTLLAYRILGRAYMREAIEIPNHLPGMPLREANLLRRYGSGLLTPEAFTDDLALAVNAFGGKTVLAKISSPWEAEKD